MNLKFRTLLSKDLAEIRPWYTDPDSNLFQFPSETWEHNVSTNPNSQAWVAMDEENLVALFQLDRVSQAGHFAMIVNPANRRQGIGQKILSYIESLEGIDEIVCFIDPMSESTNHFFIEAGYNGNVTATNSQGMVRYSKKL